LQVESVPIDKLIPDEANARLHPAKNIDAVKASLQRFGQQKPIVVRRDGVVLAGNGTLQAAKDLGWKQLGVVYTDLESAEALAFAITDNRTSELAEWDYEVLAGVLENPELEIEWPELGWTEPDVKSVLNEVGPKKGNTDPDEVPETPSEAITKPGDIWQCGEHRVLCGDATSDALPGDVDCVFADPPYNVGFKYANSDDDMPREEFVDWCRKWMGNMPRPLFVTTGRRQLADYLTIEPLTEIICWSKKNSMKRTSPIAHYDVWEPVLVLGKPVGRAGSNLFEAPIRLSDAQNVDHPCPKPIKLLERIIEAYVETAIGDPFLGSGTTLIACEQLGRICYGIEIEPKYVDVAVRRWEEFTGRKAERVTK
jgi:hypothetical protein